MSPTEIEETIFAHCKDTIADVCVAGVTPPPTDSPSEQFEDEKVPHAWVVLTPHGKKLGEKQSIETVVQAVKDNLGRTKWLAGGIEVVHEVC